MSLWIWFTQNPQVVFNIVLGLTTAYIAYQQWQANTFKLRMDLYDRRLRLYQEVNKIVGIIVRDANVELPDLWAFVASTAEADFLFGPEIREYLEEIFTRGNKLRSANREYRDATQRIPPGYDHNRVVQEMDEQCSWFAGQLTGQPNIAKQKFAVYLDVSQMKRR